MRFLIFAFLAVAVSATNYGYGSSYYSGYPSYSSYSSYPSSYYGGYGSSLYGATYGSGLGYGSGYGSSYGSGYGSGITYGSGSYGTGLTGGYTTAYKPAVYQTARYTYEQPESTWTQHRSDNTYTGTPGKIEFVLGGTGYRTRSSDYRTPVRPKVGGAFTRGSTSVLGAGAVDSGTGRISFTRDFSTVSGLSGIQRSGGASVFKKSASPVAVVTQKVPARSFHGTGSVHRSGTHGTSGYQPVTFTQDFSKVTGQSAGRTEIHGFNTAPAPVVPQRILSGPVGSIHKSEVHGITADQPHISFTQDFSKAGVHSKQFGRKPQIHSFQKPSFPVVETQHETSDQLDLEDLSDSDITQPGGIGFTKTVGEVHTTIPKPAVVSSSHKFATGGASRIPSGPVGSIHKSEVHGITAGQPHISFTQDFSKVSGHSTFGRKPQVQSFQRTSVPVIDTQHEISGQHDSGIHAVSGFSQQDGISFTQNVGGVHTTVPKPAIVSSSPKFATGAVQRPSAGYVHRTSAVHKSGSRGIPSSGEGPQIRFVQGTSALRQSDVKAFSYEKILSPAFVSRPSSGARVTGIQSNIPAQGFSTATGPSRITFTQDFSRVTGQRNSAVKPVISIDNKLTAPVFPRVGAQEFQAVRRNTAKLTSPFETKALRRPVAGAFKAPAQTVAEELSFTSVQDQSSAQGLFPVRTDADKSIFSVGQVTGIDEVGAVTGGRVSGAYHSTLGRGQFVVPSYGVATAGDAGDKSKIFVAVPADDFSHDKSFLHSTGVAPTGSFVEEKGSIVTINSGEVDSSISRQGYSSSYPGYSNLSGESPRFDFSPDRSLLYSYSSPQLASPFSYSYTTGDKYYEQGVRKTVA